MKTILFNDIVTAVADSCISAACDLPADVAAAIKKSVALETDARGAKLINQCIINAEIAHKDRIPICQDTGLAVVFAEIGTGVTIDGGTLTDAINAGVRQGYRQGYLRASVVSDPLYSRKNTGDNTPAIIHISIISGSSLTITIAPKGAGSENKSALAMLTPADGIDGVKRLVIDTVIKAGGSACPPMVIGVGIGGNFEMAPLLAKKALLRTIGSINPDQRYANLEQELLDLCNATNVGPQGLGGSTTALAVHIEQLPCHIASLPVAVNINCHVARHISITL